MLATAPAQMAQPAAAGDCAAGAPPGALALGRIARLQGDYAAAATHLLRAAALQPHVVAANRELGLLYMQQQALPLAAVFFARMQAAETLAN